MRMLDSEEVTAFQRAERLQHQLEVLAIPANLSAGPPSSLLGRQTAVVLVLAPWVAHAIAHAGARLSSL